VKKLTPAQFERARKKFWRDVDRPKLAKLYARQRRSPTRELSPAEIESIMVGNDHALRELIIAGGLLKALASHAALEQKQPAATGSRGGRAPKAKRALRVKIEAFMHELLDEGVSDDTVLTRAEQEFELSRENLDKRYLRPLKKK
jgi:hypothetical protein